MSEIQPDENPSQRVVVDERPESHDSVWLLTIAPLVWAVHLLASYLTAAIFCEKYAPASAAAGEVQIAILLYTLLALPLITSVGWHGFHRHSFGDGERSHDIDSSADRHRFLGFATFLLALLSAVATLFTALVAVFVGSCH